MKRVSFLLVLYTLALLQPALAQTCDCPEFLPLKAKWEAEGGDSKGYYSQLRASANKFCVAKSYEWLHGSKYIRQLRFFLQGSGKAV